jgi:hypothetical protein
MGKSADIAEIYPQCLTEKAPASEADRVPQANGGETH